MVYKVELSKPAAKNFQHIDPRYKSAAKKALLRLAENPHVGEPLKQELKGLWKLRFSRYRIIYEIRNDTLTLITFQISRSLP